MRELVRCKTWPKVVPNDDGIRPAGRPDCCFYCHQVIGEPHKHHCVTVLSKVRYGVFVENERVGTWRQEDPFSWSTDECEFHKNESSWCTGNALDEIEWLSEDVRDRVLAQIGDGCGCGTIEFRVDEVEDRGPFIVVHRP